MNGDTKKKIVSSEYVGKHERRKPTPVSIELDEKIRNFKSSLILIDDGGYPSEDLREKFDVIIELMFYCMYHHMYNVLYNALKEAHKKF